MSYALPLATGRYYVYICIYRGGIDATGVEVVCEACGDRHPANTRASGGSKKKGFAGLEQWAVLVVAFSSPWGRHRAYLCLRSVCR